MGGRNGRKPSGLALLRTYHGAMAVSRIARREALTAIGGVVGLLAASTLMVAGLESWLGVPDASATYLLAVLASAMYLGTWAAVGAAVGAFLLYNFLFVQPTFTFTVEDPGELLNLLLLLVLGIAVGQLAARQRSRARIAEEQEREARALFRISRSLATRTTTGAVLGEIAEILRTEAAMDRVAIGLTQRSGGERVVADTGGAGRIPGPADAHAVLQRMPGDEPAKWMRIHPPVARAVEPATTQAYRVVIEAASGDLGSVWCLRPMGAAAPARAENRVLAAAADQVGQALEQDRLAEEARAAEVARRSDALKTALLDSVSHDLRTPLAAIRAAAGTILEGPERVAEADRLASASAIDREAEHLNQLVTNLLDLSRIEAGALRADLEALDIEDAIRPILDRYRARLTDRRLELRTTHELAPAMADPVLLEQVMANLLDNAAKFVPSGGSVRVTVGPVEDRVQISIDDSGTGVPPEALSHLFEKFYRAPTAAARPRPGTGTGLAVVKGLTEAMGGRVQARRSSLGGLGIDLDLAAAPALPEGLTGAAASVAHDDG